MKFFYLLMDAIFKMMIWVISIYTLSQAQTNPETMNNWVWSILIPICFIFWVFYPLIVFIYELYSKHKINSHKEIKQDGTK